MMMKRLFAAMLCIAMMTSSCKGIDSTDSVKTQVEFGSVTAQDISLEFARSENKLTREGTIYYTIINNEWIYYWDSENDISGKLCGKPECPHVSVGCNAYVYDGSLQVYEDNLYLLQGEILYKMNKDGSGREKVMDLPGAMWVINWGIHRDNVFLDTQKQIVEDGKPYEEYTLYQYPLGNSQKGLEIVSERYEGIVVPRWTVRDEYLCFAVDEDIEASGKKRDREICLYHIPMKTWAQVSASSSKWQILDWSMQEDGIYILEKAWEKIRVIFYDFNDGNVTEQFCIKDMTGYVGIMASDLSGVIVYPRYEQKECHIYDMNGLEKVSLTIGGAYWHMAAWGYHDNGYFIETKTPSEDGSQSTLWKVGEEGAKCICKKKE